MTTIRRTFMFAISNSGRARIDDGLAIDGRLPPTVTRLMTEWTARRREALMRNRVVARTDGRLERIEGLE